METDKEPEVVEKTDIIGTIEAEQVEMRHANAMNVLGEEINMHQSAAAIVKAGKVTMENSFAMVISADEVEGDVKALFSPAAAMILGGAALLAMLIWRRR
jgi:hypothetical protein